MINKKQERNQVGGFIYFVLEVKLPVRVPAHIVSIWLTFDFAALAVVLLTLAREKGRIVLHCAGCGNLVLILRSVHQVLILLDRSWTLLCVCTILRIAFNSKLPVSQIQSILTLFHWFPPTLIP